MPAGVPRPRFVGGGASTWRLAVSVDHSGKALGVERIGAVYANLLRPHSVFVHPANDQVCGVVAAEVVIKGESFDPAETGCVDSPCARLCPRPSHLSGGFRESSTQRFIR